MYTTTETVILIWGACNLYCVLANMIVLRGLNRVPFHRQDTFYILGLVFIPIFNVVYETKWILIDRLDDPLFKLWQWLTKER